MSFLNAYQIARDLGFKVSDATRLAAVRADCDLTGAVQGMMRMVLGPKVRSGKQVIAVDRKLRGMAL